VARHLLIYTNKFLTFYLHRDFSVMKFAKLIVVFALASVFNASATVVNYTDFSDVSNFQLNNDAAQVGNVLQLTSGTSQSGSAFLTNAITLNTNVSFSSFFSFNITNSVGPGDVDGIGADGIVFTLQTLSNTAGGAGGGIGFDGIGQSVGIEFDTWNNGAIDNESGNHVGINLNGSVTSVASLNEPTRFNNGLDWFAWVDYDGASDLLSLRYSSTAVRPTLASLNYTIDLTSIFSGQNVFVGFTSGTGAAGGDHNITSFSFSDDFVPEFATTGVSAVSAPGSLPLLLLSIVALGVRSRLRN